jgi:lysophospholipase L1-like esterase
MLAGCAGSGPAPATSPTVASRPAVAAASPSTSGTTPGTPGTAVTRDSLARSGVGSAAASGLRTSCRSVVHIGDSTSDGLVLPAYQPDPKLRIAAQYRRVGVTTFIPEVSGARSIYETWHGIPNGYTVAQLLVRRGYAGCWVIALGTNDAADVAVGSAMSMPARIREMMTLIGNEPVLWVNVVTLLSSGPYAESNMRGWNRDLLRACQRYPTMRVYDWAAVARPSWFIPDGIHYTPPGYAERARLIANALAEAFPAAQPNPDLLSSYGVRVESTVAQQGCLVH